ncbi:hypothetical protein Tco_1321048, partial [Tanacetum coccineum]
QNFDLNVPKDSSNTDEAAQNGGTPKSVTFEIHHGGCSTPTPSRSYVGGQVSSVNVVDIGLDYGLHTLNGDADVLEMAKYVKDNKIILIYVEHGSSNVDSSIFVTPNNGVAIAVDNHLRNDPIEIDSSPDVNRNLTPMRHRNLIKKIESDDDPFGDLDEILGDYANAGKHITRYEIIEKHMVVHVGNSSTVDDVLDLQMLFEIEWVGPIGKFKEVEVDADNESEEESDTEGNYTSSSDSEDLDYDLKHDQVFDDDEHIVKDVHVSMNNFSFTTYPKHDLSIGDVEVREHDLDVIDYDSFDSDLDDGIDSQRRNLTLILKGGIQLRGLRRICKQKNKERVRVRCEGTIPALVPYVSSDTDMGKNVFSQTKGGPVIRENNISSKQNILGKDKTYQGKGKKVNKQNKEDNYSCPWIMLVAYTNEGKWEVRTLIEDHNCIQSREIKACTSRFLLDHIIKSLATNHDLPMSAVQDQIHKQFDVGVSKMKAFRAKRIATDKMTGSQILTVVGVDANIGIYPVAYALVEAESKASWCWFLNLLGEDLGIQANFNYTFISGRYNFNPILNLNYPHGLIQAIASVFPSAEHRKAVGVKVCKSMLVVLVKLCARQADVQGMSLGQAVQDKLMVQGIVFGQAAGARNASS